jgi:hypothetical protein
LAISGYRPDAAVRRFRRRGRGTHRDAGDLNMVSGNPDLVPADLFVAPVPR